MTYYHRLFLTQRSVLTAALHAHNGHLFLTERLSASNAPDSIVDWA